MRPYVGVALESAARFNSDVVLIGDDGNRGAWRHHWSAEGSRCPKFEQFLGSYTKMSDYPDWYERAFWQRPFQVEQWMRDEGVRETFLLDSDIVTFADYSRDVAAALPPGCDAVVMRQQNQTNFAWASSLHCSYWTLDALTDFTSFCIAAYRDPELRAALARKFRWQLEHRLPGGICEMTTLYLWHQRHETRILNLAQARRGMVADVGLGTATNYFDDEYELHSGFKKFTFVGGAPYCANRVTGETVRFLCVHCQGETKAMMATLVSPIWRRFYTQRHRMRCVLDVARARARQPFTVAAATSRSNA
jgi:hypothetical protein